MLNRALAEILQERGLYNANTYIHIQITGKRGVTTKASVKGVSEVKRNLAQYKAKSTICVDPDKDFLLGPTCWVTFRAKSEGILDFKNGIRRSPLSALGSLFVRSGISNKSMEPVYPDQYEIADFYTVSIEIIIPPKHEYVYCKGDVIFEREIFWGGIDKERP